MQTRFDSFLESCANIFVGFLISVAVWQILAYLFHTRTSFSENIAIVLIFTVTSLLRQYIIRRLFNGRSIGEAIFRNGARNRQGLID